MGKIPAKTNTTHMSLLVLVEHQECPHEIAPCEEAERSAGRVTPSSSDSMDVPGALAQVNIYTTAHIRRQFTHCSRLPGKS